jgi:fatty-acyl-CoA synthase
MGMGGVIHTINWRLFDEQIAYIVNHAEDRVLLYDAASADIVERIRPVLSSVEHFICYEEGFDAMVAGENERDPAMLCYTSGTTGNPKGVLYEHRSTVLHAITMNQPEAFNLSQRSTALPFIPLFHAAGWGVPFGCAAVGARLVLSATTDVPTMHRVIVDEKVTHAAGVPTIWNALLQHIDAIGGNFGKLRQVNVGGSAAPPAMIGRFLDMGIDFSHMWGMTEISPIGSACIRPEGWEEMGREEKIDHLRCQGQALFGAEIRIVDEAGAILPHDGKTSGYLQIRGPWVVHTYFKAETPAVDAEGWFDTGDIAFIRPDGRIQLTDRAKDVIKSGGEWISSVDLENHAMGCAGVAEAAAIGLPHPRWDERPLLLVVRKPGADVTAEAIQDHLARHVARWWLPEDIVFVDDLPHTGTGKLHKTVLRDQFRDYVFRSLRAAAD